MTQNFSADHNIHNFCLASNSTHTIHKNYECIHEHTVHIRIRCMHTPETVQFVYLFPWHCFQHLSSALSSFLPCHSVTSRGWQWQTTKHCTNVTDCISAQTSNNSLFTSFSWSFFWNRSRCSATLAACSLLAFSELWRMNMFLIDYIHLFNYYLMYTLSHVLGITFCSVCIDAYTQVLL